MNDAKQDLFLKLAEIEEYEEELSNVLIQQDNECLTDEQWISLVNYEKELRQDLKVLNDELNRIEDQITESLKYEPIDSW